ncbi:MAG TPA: ABC transporter permease [Thermoflexales bacterium]|nr:ABC transporter permease [Thermoflexales bacterium]HQW34602.1 ABC transporter permease [Thermoflexales bacterium]HQX75456.1 ABC transporter permease [Thermoflexales bacterium]
MNIFFAIALKDLKLAFRDRAALVLMLLAPFLLTLGMGFVTGRFSGKSSGISQISVVIVNKDSGQIADALVNVFSSDEVKTLVAPINMTNEQAARDLVGANKVAAVVIIPNGFSASILSAQETSPNPPKIEVYANPLAPTGTGVVESIVQEFLSRVETLQTSGFVIMTTLMQDGLVKPQDAAAFSQEMGQRLANAASQSAITLNHETPAAAAQEFDVLAYLAPGMALLFLMYTVTRGASQILAERENATLSRMMAAPASTAAILGGKVAGVFLTGSAQVGILTLGCAVIFGVRWGNPLGVMALVLACAAAATGWGLVVLAFAKSREQMGTVGSALMMLFAILSNSFGQGIPLPPFLKTLGKLTPNYWGLDGFTRLAQGQSMATILPSVFALVLMALALFAISSIGFRKFSRA